MQIYWRPQGLCFQHDEPVNDSGAYYYISYVQLPVDYYAQRR